MNNQNLNSPWELQNKFNKFVQEYKSQWNQDPKERVQQLLDSGKMTQQQYNQLRQVANMFLGTNY